MFAGTVRRLKSATMPEIPVNDRTLVVHVDRVVKAPPALASYANQDITVQLGPDATAKPGQRAVFYTQGWRFGASVAVRSLGHSDLGRVGVAASAKDPVEEKAARDLENHVADADLVVRGRVVRVKTAVESAARATGAEPNTVSEHSPRWREAVVDVDEVTKGRVPGKQIVVRFPSSTDVRWARAPKFRAGQQGVFLLHRTGALPSYDALHAHDFQPPHTGDQIRAFVRSTARRKR